MDATPRRHERGVVVGPGRSRQPGQAAPLGVRRGRVRVGVEEDVAVVEGRDEPDVLGEQHAVAEDVARHVSDPDDGEVLGLGVVADLAEVPLDRLPRTAGRDAHGLVVVSDRTPGRERVTEPEAVVLRHAVGDVGEGRGALVGGYDEIRVVAVVAPYVAGRHHPALQQVVGDVEQPADEQLVAADALGHEGVARPVATDLRQPLHDETAFGAHGDDHGVLHHLCLDEAQDLGAEVLSTVGPPQPSARDGAEAQVHALHPR